MTCVFYIIDLRKSFTVSGSTKNYISFNIDISVIFLMISKIKLVFSILLYYNDHGKGGADYVMSVFISKF